MHQQINLYQPVFRKQQKVFSATTLLQICAAVLVLLVIISIHARWTLVGMRDAAQVLQMQLGELGQQMGDLEEAYRTPDTDALDTAIENLRSNIDQRNYLLEQFDQLIVTHRTGFADQFRALAEIHIPGLWLDGVTVTDKQQIEIRGITLDAKLVPRYLQSLEKREDLSETTFETVSMSRIDTDKPHIQFVLRNIGEDSSWQ